MPEPDNLSFRETGRKVDVLFGQGQPFGEIGKTAHANRREHLLLLRVCVWNEIHGTIG
jgi:hypothetical protein